MQLIQLSQSDGSWPRLREDWAAQCIEVGEEPEQYARGTMLVLDELAAKPERRSGIFGVQKGDGAPEIICQINTTPLPAHPEPVMRIRMVTVCPHIDFGIIDKAGYIDAISELFFRIVAMEHPDLAAKEVKFHLRSPEDFNFFRAVRAPLSKLSWFDSVEMHGAWLYIVKNA